MPGGVWSGSIKEVVARGVAAEKEMHFGKGEFLQVDAISGGQKCGKLERFDLIPHEFMEEFSRVYGYGMNKYQEDNWRRGYKWSWSIAALFRHLYKWLSGESIDPPSGRHHLAMVAWHCATLYWFEVVGKGEDDRWRGGAQKNASL